MGEGLLRESGGGASSRRKVGIMGAKPEARGPLPALGDFYDFSSKILHF